MSAPADTQVVTLGLDQTGLAVSVTCTVERQDAALQISVPPSV